MALFTYLLRRSIASTRKKKTQPRPRKPGKLPIVKKGESPGKRPVVSPVKKKGSLSAPSDVWSQIIASSLPGGKKMQFPFESIPPVPVNVSIEKDTRNALLSLGGMVAGGIVLGSLLKKI